MSDVLELRHISEGQRIISLVPSQTELLHHLGLRQEVVGITKFCIHPQEWFRTKMRVGGTKMVDIDKVRSMNPTLILAIREENVREQVEEMATFCPVHLSDVNDLASATEMIREVGRLTLRTAQADALAADIYERFRALKPPRRVRAAYFIWDRPMMLAGRGTFINDMMWRAGFDNVILTERYPEMTLEALSAFDPEVILLSSEPYPFAQRHLERFQSQFPKAEVRLVDGEMFSWYGSRMLLAPDYFNSLLLKV